MAMKRALGALVGIAAIWYAISGAPERLPKTPAATAFPESAPEAAPERMPSPAARPLVVSRLPRQSASAPAAGEEKLELFRPPRYVTASALNLRSAPGTSAPVLGSLRRSTRLLVKEERDKWLLIVAPDGAEGWVSATYTSATPPAAPVPAPAAVASRSGVSRAEIVRILIERSIANYPGSCPCPENRDSAGRRCGKRSAYLRPGGRSPLCYPSDVTEKMIEAFGR